LHGRQYKTKCNGIGILSLITQAGQVKGDDPEKKGHPGSPGWGLGVGVMTPNLEKKLHSGNLRDASDRFNKKTTSWLQEKGIDFWYMEYSNIKKGFQKKF